MTAIIVTVTMAVYREVSPLFPPFLYASAAQIVLLTLLLAIEIVRSVRQFETKIVFVLAHVATVACTILIVGGLFWHVKISWDDTMDRRAKAKADAEAARVLEQKKAKAAAEEAQACEMRRKEELDRLGKRRAEARRLFGLCKEDYESSKTFFTKETLEQRCAARQLALGAAERAYRGASLAACPTTEVKK